jgi:hypothetical protein
LVRGLGANLDLGVRQVGSLPPYCGNSIIVVTWLKEVKGFWDLFGE